MEEKDSGNPIKRPQLFDQSPIDIIDSWQQDLVDNYEGVSAIIDKSETQAHVELQEMASTNMEGHEKLIDGFFYGILTQEDKASLVRITFLVLLQSLFCK
ncbi:hypothetical protein BB560_001011 [Smittium megazygosporum]|uniref:Uncharacterized protein n=1 Tax=Smittium megazygosporum TaxID=133381 RepID=A0A2T9ZIS4_9FUNG|nr:hypothetical protein BB560_005070 [Smittium megazygosporum]PVV04495.1 hypothetical protein BB560_001011 [Smittium megazygosporum]